MDFSRLVNGSNCPFETNIPVYLGTTANGLTKGAIVCTGVTGSLRGFTLSVATTTAAAKNAMGVLSVSASFAYAHADQGQGRSTKGSDFRVQADLICDRGATGGNDWLPAIVNFDALYFGWYSTTQAAATAGDTITQSITASTGTTVTIATFAQDQVGGWLFSHNSNSTGTPTFSGSLRYISVSTQTGLVGLLTAMNVSTDSSLVAMEPAGLIRSCINSTGQYLRSQGAAGNKVAQGLYHYDNYGTWDGAPMHPLRSWMDDGLNSLTGVKLYGEVFLYDHGAFNESIA